MSPLDEGFAVLLPDVQRWRESSIMKIPNANLMSDLGGSEFLGARLWRLPPYSANTWHRHADSWELYFLLEGLGRMRVGEETITVPRYGCVLVAPQRLRQVFNDTPDESLWLIIAAPQEGQFGIKLERSHFYPEDPKSLPTELAGKVWPPS
jgi:mannose-6-phosphate isomerase-like protein (cupin superfamily)